MQEVKSKQTNPAEDDNIKLINFGCKVNLYDGQTILQKLQKENKERSKIFIVNTCTVTEKSAKECQKTVRRIIRNNPNAKVIVTGCDSVINKEQYQLLPHTIVFSQLQKNYIQSESLKNTKFNIENNNYISPPQIDKDYRRSIDSEPLEKIYGRTRAFVKIEDGCDLFCSFCIIPYTRGLPTSKPIPKILDEINLLLDNGYKEIVLTGIHIGCFGKDLKDGSNLTTLIEKLSKFTHYEFRFRISSIEINELDDKLLSVLQSSKNFCPHFHLPLQSGSNKILKLMNRRYTVEYFIDKIQQIKHTLNNPSFSTDVIIGFPTETDDDFYKTLNTCEKVGFFKIHIFPYSDRHITKSSQFSPKVLPQTVKQRYKELSHIEEKNLNKYYQQFLNTQCHILIEQFSHKKNAYFGYTERYLKTLLYSSTPENLHNRFITTTPHSIKNKYLICYLP